MGNNQNRDFSEEEINIAERCLKNMFNFVCN